MDCIQAGAKRILRLCLSFIVLSVGLGLVACASDEAVYPQKHSWQMKFSWFAALVRSGSWRRHLTRNSSSRTAITNREIINLIFWERDQKDRQSLAPWRFKGFSLFIDKSPYSSSILKRTRLLRKAIKSARSLAVNASKATRVYSASPPWYKIASVKVVARPSCI